MDLIERLATTPLAAQASAIAGSALPAAELVPRPDLGPPTALGASRFGGLPDLPVGVHWPRWRNRPLTLLLQLDLAEIEPLLGHLLPKDGTLLFFYDVARQPWGERSADRGSWRVLYAAPDEPMRRQRHPAPSLDAAVLPEVALQFVPTTTYPSLISDDALYLEDDDEDYDNLDDCFDLDTLYRELVLGDDRVRHLLLGHPDPIQRDPVGRGAVSLLQLDSDPLLRSAWGDAGKLHFTIGTQALAERRFENTGFELQCC